MKPILSVALALLVFEGAAEAELIPSWPPPDLEGDPEMIWHGDDPGLISIAGYDIDDAVLPASGRHAYNGTVTPSGVSFEHTVHGEFDDYTISGQTATYRGGTGTLTDGYIGAGLDAHFLGTFNTMRFLTPQASDGTPINPAITFTMAAASTIDAIDLYGGDLLGDNRLPGMITDVAVTLILPDLSTITETIATMPFGYSWDDGTDGGGHQYNDRLDLTGTSLEGVEAVAFQLSDFQGTLNNQFSLSEVRAFDGPPIEVLPPFDAYPPIKGGIPHAPEPGTLALLSLGSGISLIGGWYRRRKAAAA